MHYLGFNESCSFYICIKNIGMNPPKPRVLICPLDWGLGHATRCIPIIREMIINGAEVMVASDGNQLILLQTEFPDIRFIRLPGYNITYGRKIPVGLKVIADLPRLLYLVASEHRQIKKLVKTHSIDLVISDNRYGLWNRSIYTVFITHQVNIIPPPALILFSPLLRMATRFFMKHYNETWIPDVDGDLNLSGKLSHGRKLPGNTKFIGLLSRFDKTEKSPETGRRYEIVAIVSGPEPQRSIFEEKLLAKLPVDGKQCLLIRGIPGDTRIKPLKNGLDVADHLNTGEFGAILASKPLVICRAGYSTLMDIAFTGNKAILVPTPGQTEQLYLADNLDKSGIYVACKQYNFNLSEAVTRAVNLPGPELLKNPAFLPDLIYRLVQVLQKARVVSPDKGL